MDNDNIIGLTVVLAVGFIIYIFWQRSQEAQMVTALNNQGFTPTGPPTAEQVAISSIPVVGPALNYTVVSAGNAIAGNKFLTENSQVSPGKSANQAGVLYVGTHWQNGGLGGLAKHLEFWNW